MASIQSKRYVFSPKFIYLKLHKKCKYQFLKKVLHISQEKHLMIPLKIVHYVTWSQALPYLAEDNVFFSNKILFHYIFLPKCQVSNFVNATCYTSIIRKFFSDCFSYEDFSISKVNFPIDSATMDFLVYGQKVGFLKLAYTKF